jgi:hypothetical protein
LGICTAPGARFLLSAASLGALGYEYNLSDRVISQWNDTEHVGN